MKPLQKSLLALSLALPLISGCGGDAPAAPPSLSGVAAASDQCAAPGAPVAEHGSDENPLFTPLDIQPATALAPLLGNVRARATTSLNGEWQSIVDQLGVGDASPLLYGGVGENRSYNQHELLEYSFEGAESLQVPGDWNSQRESLFWYRGVVWYQKQFDYQPDPSPSADKRVFLYFGGANYQADVYLNGKLLARHKGGFTPFNIEVTDFIKAGDNGLVVKVDSMSGADEIPTEHNDWKNFGGITRDVMLVETPHSFVSNYKLQLKAGRLDTVEGWVQLDGAKAGDTVSLSIKEAGIEQQFGVDASGLARFEFEAELAKWSPQSPKLYRVDWQAGGDSISDEIGFRSFATDGEDLLLNGEKVFLRGVSMHEESLLREGRAVGAADADAAIAKLKALNANFVRLAHYPHNEHMVRAADRAGIMVWAEIPVYHNIQFGNPCTLAAAKQQYSELIDRDQNRAAVVMWSLGNETQPGEARNAFFVAMAEHVRAEDNTRPLTAALLGFGGMEKVGRYLGMKLAGQENKLVDLVTNPDVPVVTIDDPLGDIVDVLGYNEYFGWYMSGMLATEMRKEGLDVSEKQVRDMMLTEMEQFSLVTPFGKPLVISEFGAGAKQGMRGGDLDIWTEDYQARVYRQQLKMLENSPALRGLSPWVLKDFRAPYRLNTVIQDYWNRKGLVSETGEPKLAFKVMSDHYLNIKNGE